MFKLKLESETLKLCLKTLSYDVNEWIPVREWKKKNTHTQENDRESLTQ